MDSAIIDAQNRIKNKRNQYLHNKNKPSKKSSNYISNLFTRTLLSAILVLSLAIFVHSKDENLLFFKEKLFNESLAFTKINELYTKYFGSLVPETPKVATPVFQNNSLYNDITPYNDSYKAKVSGPINFLESGIVVFSGEKEGLGNTVIIQGIDGVDIWYSNIENVDLTLYDYVEKNNILGNAKDGEVILTFLSDGNYISYEKYIS